MKNRLPFLLILLTIQSAEAQHTIEFTHWKYTNDLNSKQKRQATVLENYDAGGLLLEQTTPVYDDSGLLQLAYWSGRTKEGSIYTRREQYFYDSSGRLIKMIETSDGHYRAQTHLYQYATKDSNQIVTELLSATGKKKVKTIITTYNSACQHITNRIAVKHLPQL